MKKKTLGLLSFGILALVMFVSFVSAITITPNSLTFKSFETSKTFNITNDGTTVVTLTSQTITDNQNPTNSVTITFNDTSIAAGATEPIIATLGTIPSEFVLGIFSTNYLISESGNSSNNANLTLNFENTPNEFLDNGNLDIDIDDLSVENGFGKDNEWFPLDEINAKIFVENNGNEKIKNIVVEWGLYDKDTGKFVVDEEEDDFNLDDGDDKTLNINFKLDKVNKLESDNNYVFYAWATGEDEETDNKTSVSDSEDIEVIIESDFVILDNIQILESARCGDEVQITADVWNIGEDDQEGVFIEIFNSELKIGEEILIGDIDAFDKETLDFIFKVPSDAKEKFYTIKLTVYDEDRDIYQNDYDDDKAEFTTSLKIEGACVYDPKLTITANLESGGTAGQELVVKSTMTNTDSKTRTFTITASDYESWAELVKINPTSLTLNAGESKEVLLTFNVNSDVSGEQTFDIEILSEEQLIATQPASVLIEKAGFSLTGITGAAITGENWYLWGIGAFNVILVLIIIIVAVKLVRKK